MNNFQSTDPKNFQTNTVDFYMNPENLYSCYTFPALFCFRTNSMAPFKTKNRQPTIPNSKERKVPTCFYLYKIYPCSFGSNTLYTLELYFI
jgi:hypothetical protein